MNKQGQKANSNGKKKENQIKEFLRNRNIPVMTQGVYNKLKVKPKEVFITNPSYESVYGHKGRSNGQYKKDGVSILRLTQISQEVPGSVDEKFPYMMENLKEGQFPEPNQAFLVEGSGFKDGAVAWFKAKCLKYKGKQNVYFFQKPDDLLKLIDNFA